MLSSMSGEHDAEAAPLTEVCAYCRAVKRGGTWTRGAGPGFGPSSHGICPACFDREVEAQLRDFEREAP
jgi:hypothetical protein